MQNVACPATIVASDSDTPPNAKNEFSAIPVMIPGSASGRTSANDTASRPKNRNRCTANAAIVPSAIAIAVEISPALTDSQSAWRMSALEKVDENHFVDSPAGGQLWMFDELNA